VFAPVHDVRRIGGRGNESVHRGLRQQNTESAMKAIIGCAVLALSVAAASAPAMAKGCIKGAVVGGAAGHVAGHHGVIGAAVGCAIGHHEAKRHEREMQNSPQPR
jgi:hypothetical protein